MQYTCVLLAAGKGSRTGLDYNKVFYKLDDKTIIEKSIYNFNKDKDCKQIIIVIDPSELIDFKKLNLGLKVEFVNGGSTRQSSVYNGLKKVNEEKVMIHDGARPFVTKKIINDVKEALKAYNACLVMVKSVDTIKVVDNNVVKTTPNRETLYNAQTPQAFRTNLIIKAYQNVIKNQLTITDDAQAYALAFKDDIYVVKGDYNNIKITNKKDLR